MSTPRIRRILLALYLFVALGDATAKALAVDQRLNDVVARRLPGRVASRIESAQRPQGNFEIFREASRRLIQGEDAYASYSNKNQDRFKYSPTFALFFVPLTRIPWPVALFVWSVVNAVVLFIALERLLPVGQASVALACLLPEVLRSTQNAQSNALVAALIILAFLAIERGRVWRAAVATVVGAFIKIFPLAALTFAIPHRKTPRVGIAALTVGVALALAPLIVITPAQLLAEYRSWMTTESADASQRWFSVMDLVHRWLGVDWPNWPIQLVGTIVLLAPLAIRRTRWSDERFRLSYLCSVLVYLSLFNHQAERSSYLIAFVGASIWFVTNKRTAARVALYSVVLITIPLMSTLLPIPDALRTPAAMTHRLALPMLVIWLVMQHDLLNRRGFHGRSTVMAGRNNAAPDAVFTLGTGCRGRGRQQLADHDQAWRDTIVESEGEI
jgi:hypothetical protein